MSLNICFTIDATGSMGTTLTALKDVFSQLCPILPLFIKSNFHLVIYRDFDSREEDIYQYHGPFEAKDMLNMAKIITNTQAKDGGDEEECQKFAFWRLLDDVPSENLVIFHFTDAPPHSFPYPVNKGNNNHGKEGYHLRINDMNPNWIQLCKTFQEKKIPVYTIGQVKQNSFNYYSLLAEYTGAEMILLKNTTVQTILKTTIIVFARAFGYDECNLKNLASLVRIADPNNLQLILTEDSLQFRNLKTIQIEFNDENQYIEVRQAFTNQIGRTILEERYKSDPEYQEICYKTFIDMITDGHILALTYNPLLGCLYRQMCRKSKVAEMENKREALNKIISDRMNKLKNQDQTLYKEVATWIEESYNRIEEINELIISIEGPIIPFLSLQTVKRFTKKDLTLACKIPMPQNLRMLGELISSIVVIDKKPKTMPEVFVPLSLEDDLLFSMLSHLMCPGVKLDVKPSIVVALVTINSGNAYLEKRALEYLRKSCGKWFNKEDSEWYLFGIIKMLLRLENNYNGIITSEEKSYFESLFLISTLKFNNPLLSAKRKFVLEPIKGMKYPDHKANCLKCNQFRSISIMTPNGCGICVGDDSLENNPGLELEDDDEKKSYLYDCVICGGRYAVRNIEGLKTRPKCHYCRQMPPLAIDQIPKIHCSICDIKMIIPEANKFNSDNFMCAVCVENNGEERIETIDIRLHDLLEQNAGLASFLIGYDIDLKLLIGRESLFSLRNKYTKVEYLSKFQFPMIFNNRPILNSDEILTRILEIVKTGSIDTETCIVCYNDFIHHELYSFCLNKNCKALGCQNCIKNWFSENEPGLPLLQNRTICPCCKQTPKKGLAFTNSCLKTLLKQNIVLDPDWHYAWCKGCGLVKEYMERQCAGPDPMEIKNFVCEDCMKPGEYKACPFCNIPTVKLAGCDHMECPVNLGGCGIHWCYRCEGPTENIFSSKIAQDVYDHLHEVHGNIWGAGDNDEIEEEEEEEEED